MNFLDVNPEGLIERTSALFAEDVGKDPEPLDLVFWRQAHLMGLYLPIEKSLMRGRALELPLDLHDAEAQSYLKERAWWVTEELIEAQWGCWEKNTDKVVEELADALHFQTELCISAGGTSAHFPPPPRKWPYLIKSAETSNVQHPMNLRHYIMAIMEELGIGMWHFRNKAWKQTQALTDIKTFRECMSRAQRGIIDLLGLYGLAGQNSTLGTLDFAVIAYLRKSEVNLWRIKTQY